MSHFGLENAVPTNNCTNYIASCMETDKYKLAHVEQVFEVGSESTRQSWLYVFRKLGFREFVKTNSKGSNPLFATLLYFRHKRRMMDNGLQSNNKSNFKYSAYESLNDDMRGRMPRMFDHFPATIPAAAILVAVVMIALLLGVDDVVRTISVAVSVSAMIVVTWSLLVVRACKEAQRQMYHLSFAAGVTSEDKKVFGKSFYYSPLYDSSTIAEIASLPFASFPYNRTDGVPNPSAEKWCSSTELFAGLAALPDSDIDEMCDFVLDVQKLKRAEESSQYALHPEPQKDDFGKSKRFFKTDLSSMFMSASYNGLMG